MDAAAIVAGLGGTWRGDHGVASCPVPGHGRGRGDLHPSLSIADGDEGRVLVHCHAGCDPGDIIHVLRQRGWTLERQRKRDARPISSRRPRPTSRKEAAQQTNPSVDALWRTTWRDARPLPGTPGERYLKQVRRVGLPEADVVRFHPRAPFSNDGRWCVAGIVALVQAPNGAAIGLQVTALKADGSGKLAHPKTRHTFGAIASGAVRLAPIQGEALAGALAVAEGLESALAFAALSGYPTWAALGSNLASFICPPNVEELVIAGDHDAPGLKAARTLAAREARERFVEIRHPEQEGEDWADVAARWETAWAT